MSTLDHTVDHNFDRAFHRLLGHEGGYSHHPDDPGGETMWGITADVARAAGYQGAMRDLPLHIAKAIYSMRYWTPVRAAELPPLLRFEMFDAAVNSGPRQAVRWLQQALGIEVDGDIGPQTLAAVASATQCAGDDGFALAVALNAIRLDFMNNLPTWPSFGRGWAQRIATNLQDLAQARLNRAALS